MGRGALGERVFGEYDTMLCMCEAALDPVGRLVAGVDALAGGDLEGRSARGAGEELVAIRRQIDRLEAEFVRRLSHFERVRGFVADGCPSLVAWLRTRCGLAAGSAAGRAEVARELPVLPEADRLFRAGEIGLDSALVLARTVTEIGPEATTAHGADLVDAAQNQDPTRLREQSRRLRYMADPDGARSAYQRLRERRFLSLNQTSEGGFVVDGMLDPEGGATLKTAIGALCGPLRGDPRSPGQRRADALVELADRRLRSGRLPSAAGQRPHLMVTVSLDALRGDTSVSPAELAGAGPIPTEIARRIACDAALTVITLDGNGEPLNVGRSSRTAPAAIRRALAVRDKGCRFPGCDRPVEWTDAHHITEWEAEQGETNSKEMCLFCRFHHTFVHEGGWHVSRTPGGDIIVRPP